MLTHAKRLARRLLHGPGLARHARRLLGNPDAPVLFDVGANTGQTAAEFLAAFRRPQLYCFEPSPQTHAGLARSLAGRAGVVVENLALSDREGELAFHLDPAYPTNDSPQPPAHAGTTAVTVRATTADAYCAARGIGRVDLLKVDTQGHDLAVLRGAAGLLAAGAVRLFAVELILARLYDGQPAASALFAFAEGHGYRLEGVYEQTFWAGRLAYCDLLFGRA